MITATRLRQATITLAARALGVALRPLVRRPRLYAPPRRILVVRRCCLGDVVMTTPLLAVLDAAYPEATITYATGRWSRAALENNPHLDAVLELPDRLRLRDWPLLARRLRRSAFDLALLPERSPLIGLLALAARIPRRVGLDSAGRGFALTDPVPVPAGRHETDLALDLARALNLSATERRPHYYPSRCAQEKIATLLTAAGITARPLIIHPGGGVNPGVTMSGKRWLPERFGQVADQLVEWYGVPVALVGAESDRAAVEATLAAMRHRATNFCGQLSLDEVGALCSRARLYVANDAGTTHLAEAAGAPTVVIFGPTDPGMYRPTDGIGEAVWNEVTCAPYLRRGDLTRPSPASAAFRCIDTITVDDVLAAADRVIARAGALTPQKIAP